MDLYNAKDMPLSIDPEVRIIQEKQLRGDKLTLHDAMKLEKKGMGPRDHTITKIGDYECKPDHCYRCISESTLEVYKKSGYIKDERRLDYIEGKNNQGIDWYLGGAMPGRHYGFIIIECPADKNYFQPAKDGGYGMSNDINVRHMKSSPQNNPIPISMITNIFDYKKIKEKENSENLVKFLKIREKNKTEISKNRIQQLSSLQQVQVTQTLVDNIEGGKTR